MHPLKSPTCAPCAKARGRIVQRMESGSRSITKLHTLAMREVARQCLTMEMSA